MGTKAKFWYRAPNGEEWLFKFARDRTGEHWSEKIASEIGAALGVPCARVELACCDGLLGSVSRSFIDSDQESLVHGNELLQEVDESYPSSQLRGVSKYTVDAVLERLDGVQPPRAPEADLTLATDWFVGYLLLDAMIGNGDRHHENWGVLHDAKGRRRLAPSYDHASSLGRELSDETRRRRLSTRDDAFTVRRYVERARSPLYSDVSDARPLHPAAAFQLAGQRRPTAFRWWLARMERVRADELERIVARVPDSMISEPAREFALAVVDAARQTLSAFR
ncbi:MAG: HipA domain-containing protein [Nannocystaceae bacterium]